VSARPASKTVDAAEDPAERIRAAIARVPRGRVCSYGGIARVAGLPGRARLVGTVLRNSPSKTKLPWFRILTASGKLAFPEGSEPYLEQRRRLEAEGVRFASGRVDLERYGWPRDASLDEALWGMGEAQ
jgi:methylated-DNA-protein-cysteine methyltransferase related protein